MNMVERVARALDPLAWEPNASDLVASAAAFAKFERWEKSKADARAAIEAMREPTDAMVDAGQWQIDPVSLYQTFIDAALNEEG